MSRRKFVIIVFCFFSDGSPGFYLFFPMRAAYGENSHSFGNYWRA